MRRLTSTAGSLADKQMEIYRQASFASLPHNAAERDHADRPGRSHLLDAGRRFVDLRVGTFSAGPPASCSGTPCKPSREAVTINVRDGSASARLLFSETTTFDSSTS